MLLTKKDLKSSKFEEAIDDLIRCIIYVPVIIIAIRESIPNPIIDSSYESINDSIHGRLEYVTN